MNALGKIALKNGQSEMAEAKFRNAIQRIESLRSQLQLSRLKADFLADKRDVYDALIKLLLERNDVAAAFEFMERSRARVFQDRFFVASFRLTLLRSTPSRRVSIRRPRSLNSGPVRKVWRRCGSRAKRPESRKAICQLQKWMRFSASLPGFLTI